MGTAITPEQVKLLSAYAEEAVLALDADRAGREAMLRAQAVRRQAAAAAGRADAGGQGPGRPARRRRRGERDRFRAAIEAAEDLPVFHVHTLLDDADLSTPRGATGRSTRWSR